VIRQNKDWGTRDGILDVFEGFLLSGAPFELHILLREVEEGSSVVGEVRETKEGLYFLLRFQDWPVSNTCNLDWVHFDLDIRYDDAQILHLFLLKLTFLWSKIQLVLAKTFHYNSTNSTMFFNRVRED
jgi:hypothetical protein